MTISPSCPPLTNGGNYNDDDFDDDDNDDDDDDDDYLHAFGLAEGREGQNDIRKREIGSPWPRNSE